MTTQTFSANFSDLDASPLGRDMAWVGVQSGAHRYAIPASDLLALVDAREFSPSAPPAPLDVVVHAGSPVFIVPFHQLFDVAHPGKDLDTTGRWILISRLSSGACLGCRVSTIEGPFSAQVQGLEVMHANFAWTVLRSKKERHGE